MKELNVSELDQVAGGMSVVRSGGFTSGSSFSRAPTSSERSPAASDAFERFFARREEARARAASRPASTGGGFSASAAISAAP